jgi:hypothetical protein
MLRRPDLDDRPPAYAIEPGATGAAEPIVAAIPDAEFDATPLPPEHPRWVKDAAYVSQRARDVIASLRPVVIRVLSFWDHRVRSLSIAGGRLSVDVSGSYRLQ